MNQMIEFNNIEILDICEKVAKNRDIYIFDCMNERPRKRLHKIIDMGKNVDSFSVGFGSKRYVVIKYTSNIIFDCSTYINKANLFFKLKKYKDALALYKMILGTNKPNEFIYEKIGLCYEQLEQYDMAVKYLFVANEMSRLTDNYFNYEEKIKQLKEKELIYKQNQENEIVDLSFMDNIKEKMISNEMSLKEAISFFNLTKEQLCILKLTIAKDYFIKDYFNQGEKYLRDVEKEKDKTKYVKKLFNEIMVNKRFYKNRNEKTIIL